MTQEPGMNRLMRATLDTAFHIDFAWWERADRDVEVYLRTQMCLEHQQMFSDLDSEVEVDFVDPKTAEITRVAGIQHVLISHCARQEDYLTSQTTLTNAVFRTFLANGNQPLTPNELAVRMGRPANTILRTLSGPRVYKGIRPILGD